MVTGTVSKLGYTDMLFVDLSIRIDEIIPASFTTIIAA